MVHYIFYFIFIKRKISSKLWFINIYYRIKMFKGISFEIVEKRCAAINEYVLIKKLNKFKCV